MVEHLDQEEKLERRTLRKASELFLQRLREHHEYNAADDFAKSIDEAYRVIRARVAAGGKGWTPP